MSKTNNNSKGNFQSIGSLLANRQPRIKNSQTDETQSYTHEFQVFGDQLTHELDDEKHRGLYMKLAKDEPRSLLEKALSSVRDAKARNRAALFMWKLGQLKGEGTINPKTPKLEP